MEGNDMFSSLLFLPPSYV